MIAPLNVATEPLLRALENLTGLLTADEAATDPARLASIQAARSEVAAVLGSSALPPPPQGPAIDALLQTAELLGRHPAGACAVAPPHALTRGPGWFGCIAKLFSAPAWQHDGLRAIDDLPPRLWPVYAVHMFAAPVWFNTVAEETRWAAHITGQLETVIRMLSANRGSATSRQVAEIALEAANRWPAAGDATQLRQRQSGIARLQTLLEPRLVPLQSHEPPSEAFPLRVALIHDDQAASTDVFDAERLRTLLDPERIELTVHHACNLPEDAQSRIGQLRADLYDAAIFAGDLTVPYSPLSQIALHRIAPVQLVTARSPHTTGIDQIDWRLTGPGQSPQHHTERLVQMPAPLAFEQPDNTSDDQPPGRNDFDLPENVRLLVATAHPRHTTASVRAAWETRLEADPTARLILLPGTSGAAMRQLLAACQVQLGDRLVIAGEEPLPATALRPLLRVCDTYLPDTHDLPTVDLALQLGLDVPGACARTDCLAFADTLTAVLEQACRHPGQIPQPPATPTDTASRHRQGLDLLTFGRPDRAVLYLLAAIDSPDAGPEVWHDLGRALHANGQGSDAVQALETCVRLAPERLDSWLLLSDWATDYGQDELVRDIAGIVRELAPEDPRVTALAERIAV